VIDSADALLRILLAFRHPPILRHVQWEFVSPTAIATLFEDPASYSLTESPWRAVAGLLTRSPPSTAPQFNSLIVDEFPQIFEEFRAKSFELLWRGSRDGFGAAEFHCRCDGQANILTLILDTSGNTFSGFTPVEWDSSSGYKGNDSVRSFLFTLTNPHGVLARKFVLRGEKKQNAICCNSGFGPIFGFIDICVANDCNANTRSFTRIGTNWGNRTYANNTTIAEFLTGAFNFTVKEIEAFKIAG
jgi:hypothetical protein